MPAAETHFAQTYREARGKFVAAAESAGLDVHAHRHPMVGRDGESLAMDVARFGPADAQRLLLITSGCHGVEGFCGSGIQVALLSDGAWHAAAAQAGVAVLYVHALNPYGFSWWRRTTHENVDLNRNFLDFHAPLPHNAGYVKLARAIVPATWPPPPSAAEAFAHFAALHGERELQRAVTGGQHEDPEGLFYGGRDPTWSNQTFRHVLQDHGRRCRHLAWIDLHTGLGPSGHGERIFFDRPDAQALARARTWWGERVTSMYDGSSASAQLSGMGCEAVHAECPQAQYTGIAMEYGTLPLLEVLDAMRADQWLELHPETPADAAAPIKQRMRDAFYTDTPVWKQQVVDQATDAARQALAGLAASH